LHPAGSRATAHRILHGETGMALQKRLYFEGGTLVVRPARVT
jgi:hypothetical protein